jgi:hypothetical protein
MDALPDRVIQDPDLEKEIREVFPAVALSRTEEIVYPGRWFDEVGELHSYEDPEGQSVGRFLVGKAWPEIVGAPLLEWGPAASSLVSLTPRGLAVYLPAYLCTFLEWQHNGFAWTILDSVVSRLIAPEDAIKPSALPPNYPQRKSGKQSDALLREQVEHFAAFHLNLTDAQKKCVAHFLRAAVPLFDDDWGENRAQLALDSFWGAHNGGANAK